MAQQMNDNTRRAIATLEGLVRLLQAYNKGLENFETINLLRRAMHYLKVTK